MSNLLNRKTRRQLRSQRLRILLIVLFWSLVMGWVLALVSSAQGSSPPTADIGTVDVVPQRHQLGQELYLQNCASCHIALPPAVLPTEIWRDILRDTQHYGVQLKSVIDPPRVLIWNYLKTFSRTLAAGEDKPFRVNNSRYFKALHPKVQLPRPVEIGSCVSCHPGANEYNFRRLTPDLENGG
ncbi:MAG: cytochrome C [Nostocaceae cyanobacterium]|nr:cytochrome C [Nostocaceae cyanobacterium]